MQHNPMAPPANDAIAVQPQHVHSLNRDEGTQSDLRIYYTNNNIPVNVTTSIHEQDQVNRTTMGPILLTTMR